MNRETREIIVPISKRKVLIKSWITAGEDQEIQSVMFKEMKMKVSGKDFNFDSIDGTCILEREKKCMEMLIESIDGKSENIMDTMLAMDKRDYDIVKREIDKIVDPEKPE